MLKNILTFFQLFLPIVLYSQKNIITDDDIQKVVKKSITEICNRDTSFISISVANLKNIRHNTNGYYSESDLKKTLEDNSYDLSFGSNSNTIPEQLEAYYSNNNDCKGKYALIIKRDLLPNALKELSLFRSGGALEDMGDPGKLASLGKLANIRYFVIPSLTYELIDIAEDNNSKYYDKDSFTVYYDNNFYINIEIKLEIFSVEVGNFFFVNQTIKHAWANTYWEDKFFSGHFLKQKY